LLIRLKKLLLAEGPWGLPGSNGRYLLVIYLRYITRQEKAIQDYAELNGITIEKIYREEGVSGTLQDRPALAQMMVSLEQNGFGVKTILIEKVDRLARDLMIQEAIINDLQKKGFDLISAVEGDDLLSGDPTRKLVRQVLGAIVEYDKTMTVLKLRTARERIRARDGKCEGRKGYSEVAPDVTPLLFWQVLPYTSAVSLLFLLQHF